MATNRWSLPSAVRTSAMSRLKKPDQIADELALRGLVALHLRQATDAVPQQAAVKRETRQMWEVHTGSRPAAEAYACGKPRQRPSTRARARWIVAPWPGLPVGGLVASPPFAHRFLVDPVAGQRALSGFLDYPGLPDGPPQSCGRCRVKVGYSASRSCREQ